jgi:hypothetical protein
VIKQKINYWIDLIMFFSFFINSISGLFLWFLFPYGEHSSRTVFLELSKHQWKTMHIWSGLLLLILVFIHLLLHKKWIFMMTKNIFCKKNNK